MFSPGAHFRVGRGISKPGWADDVEEPHPQGAIVGSALSAATGLAGDSKGAVRGSSVGGELLAALRFLAMLPTHFLSMLRRVLPS